VAHARRPQAAAPVRPAPRSTGRSSSSCTARRAAKATCSCATRRTSKSARLLARQNYILQEYIIGVPLYIHYFYSPLTGKLEIMSMDRRYETNVDSLGRIPAARRHMDIDPELRRGRQLAALAARVDAGRSLPDGRGRRARQPGDLRPKGLFGAFCIETIITPDAQFYIMEISARIVAGTNLFIDGSPYSYLNYSEPMSTGRRIAREIKNALLSNAQRAHADRQVPRRRLGRSDDEGHRLRDRLARRLAAPVSARLRAAAALQARLRPAGREDSPEGKGQRKRARCW
jgi:hypothetical protein